MIIDGHAHAAGVEDYAYYPMGGWSWSIPYIAGLYALTCQVKPDVTPDLFWTEALKTGEVVNIVNGGKKYVLEKIVNPLKLIENLAGVK
jgi:hypothetical protein